MMARGTANVLPKPPTAKQWQKIATTYELAMNSIIEATKRLDPNAEEWRLGRDIRETAMDLRGLLHALADHAAAEELERR